MTVITDLARKILLPILELFTEHNSYYIPPYLKHIVNETLLPFYFVCIFNPLTIVIGMIVYDIFWGQSYEENKSNL